MTDTDTSASPRCGATGRYEGEAVHCDLPKGHTGSHRDWIEGTRWTA